MVPNVKSMDSEREPKACDAILQAVGQRRQLIPEALAMIQCLQMSRGEEFVSSLPSDKDVRAEQDEPNRNSTDIQGVPISWKCRTGKVHRRTGCCQNYSQNIGHAVEIVKVC